MSYYVWPAHSSGKPVAGEGPWGPYTPLTRAKTFARIGAQKGSKDRIVTQGRDPDRIVRHYRAKTGERVHDNPGRPPKHWIRDCIKGVRAGGSAKDPGAVCGALWHHKLSESQRREILKKERKMGGLVENPMQQHCENPGRNRVCFDHKAVVVTTPTSVTRIPWSKFDEANLSQVFANPSDAYQTWLMGVRRQLTRWGYPEASKRVNAADPELDRLYRDGWSVAAVARMLKSRPLTNPTDGGPSGGTVLAWVAGLGVAGALAWLVLRKPEEAAKAPGTKSCDVDLGKLHVFAMSKQLLGVYLANWYGYTAQEGGQKLPLGAPLWADYISMQPSDGVSPTGLPTWTPPLLVLRDGTFWTYDFAVNPPFPKKRDDLREEYCTFAGGKFTRVSDVKGDPASLFVL